MNLIQVNQSRMASCKQLTLCRLQKEERKLKENPLPGILVQRQNLLDFHFVLHNLDEEYQGGFYHGLLQLHENYPFSAPKLFFYTKNGRFEVNMPICTSFTNYHQESWSSAWNVRTLLLATVSFMNSNQNSYGCSNEGKAARKRYAQESLGSNFANEKFVSLFREQLEAIGVQVPKKEAMHSLESNIDVERHEINQDLIEIRNRQMRDQERRARNMQNCRKIVIVSGSAIIVGLLVLAFKMKVF